MKVFNIIITTERLRIHASILYNYYQGTKIQLKMLALSTLSNQLKTAGLENN